MIPQRIVLIGGPSTGKTTLLNALKSRGYHCLEEVSRQVTLAAKEEGIEQLFLTEPLLFSDRLLESRIKQYFEAAKLKGQVVFIDRGIPDVSAYMDLNGLDYPAHYTSANTNYRYDQIFVLPIWEDIYTTDNERYESFDEAKKIQEAILKTYRDIGYAPIEVPKTSVENRVNFILQELNP